MILKNYALEKSANPPMDGELKAVLLFAWQPRRVGDKLIWLEHYWRFSKWHASTNPYWRVMAECRGWDIKEAIEKLT